MHEPTLLGMELLGLGWGGVSAGLWEQRDVRRQPVFETPVSMAGIRYNLEGMSQSVYLSVSRGMVLLLAGTLVS
jgi:hypothetical protein